MGTGILCALAVWGVHTTKLPPLAVSIFLWKCICIQLDLEELFSKALTASLNKVTFLLHGEVWWQQNLQFTDSFQRFGCTPAWIKSHFPSVVRCGDTEPQTFFKRLWLCNRLNTGTFPLNGFACSQRRNLELVSASASDSAAPANWLQPSSVLLVPLCWESNWSQSHLPSSTPLVLFSLV